MPSMIIGDVAASEWLAARRVRRVFPSIPLTCVLLPPGRRATLASQPDSLSREDNGIFPSTAGKKRLTALGEGVFVFLRTPHPAPLPTRSVMQRTRKRPQ